MTRKELDLSKKYGDVFGQAPYRYEQEGRFFDHNGLEVDETGKPIDNAPKAAAPAPTPPAPEGGAAGKPVDEASGGIDYGAHSHGHLNSLLKRVRGRGVPGGTKTADLVALLRQEDQAKVAAALVAMEAEKK